MTRSRAGSSEYMYFSVFGSTIQFMASLLVQGPRTNPPPRTVALFVGRRPRPPLSSAAILPGILQAASRVSNKRSGEAARERAPARAVQVALHAVPGALSAARRVQAGGNSFTISLRDLVDPGSI